MNCMKTDSPSKRLVREVFFDSDAVENNWKKSFRLKDRKFTVVHSPSISEHQTQQEDDETVEARTFLARENKATPLTKGCQQAFVDASLLGEQNNLSDRRRLEKMRLNESDIVEIPVATLHGELDDILKKRLRSRRETTTNGLAETEEERKFCRIGEQYQATVHSHLGDEEPSTTDFGVNQLWDPQKAAKLPPEDLERYLDQSKEFGIKMLLLEALHSVNYDLEEATRRFYKIHAQRQGLSVTFSETEHEKFVQLCQGSVIGKRKNFREAARLMNRPVEAILVQYYIWKAKNRATYNTLKNKRRREPEECSYCKDGGLLIVCNSCCRAFHLGCLQPQLTKIPDGDWYCSLCTHHSPSRLRRPIDRNDDTVIATRLDFERSLNGGRTPQAMQISETRLESLRSAHKEFSFLARKQEPAEKNMNATPTGHSSKRDQTLDSPASLDFYGNFYSDDDDDVENFKATPLESGDDSMKEEPDSDYKSEEDDSDDGDLLDTEVGEAPSKRRKTEAVNSVRNVYFTMDLALPICPKGFHVMLGSREDGSVVFVEYARGPHGEKGYAEACNLLHRGDVITHVDGYPCEKDIRRTVSFLRTPCDIGVKVIRIMRSKTIPMPPILPRSSIAPNGPAVYTFLLPALPEGYCLQLVETSTPNGPVCIIGGYKSKPGQKGFAELYNVFRQGDELVEIDGCSCFGVKLAEIVTMFKKKSASGWRVVGIRRQRQSSDDALKRDEAKTLVDQRINKRDSASYESISGLSGTNFPVPNNIRGERKSDIEQFSKTMMPPPSSSADPRNDVGAPSTNLNLAEGSTHFNNLLGVQAQNPLPQHPPTFQNDVGKFSAFPPIFFQPSTYQNIQPSQFPYAFPLNNLPSHLQPAWQPDFSNGTVNNSKS